MYVGYSLIVGPGWSAVLPTSQILRKPLSTTHHPQADDISEVGLL
jgi:hypothetical protein